MNINEIVPAEWSNQRVLTTEQVAEFYGVSATRIKDNLRKSKKHFVEGRDYFKLEGDVLRQMQARVEEDLMRILAAESFRSPGGYQFALSPLKDVTRSVNVYTIEGAARHCKMLNTPKAWEIFNELVTGYFERKVAEPPPVQDSLFPDVEAVKPKKRRPAPKLAVVYVVEFENGWSKLGFSSNLSDRIAKLMEDTKLDYTRYAYTMLMPLEDARQLEAALKTRFADSHLQGEFYSAPFDDIKNALTTTVPDARVDKLLAIADRMEPCPERNQLLLQAANLINEKKPF